MLVPLFPLPNVVHFPGTLLPLHIFEPRYRQMVSDLLAMPAAERRIGMVLVAAEDDPLTLCQPGCVGRLVHHEALEDGRSNIVLEGEFRFRIESELAPRPYHRAEVTALEDSVPLIEDERANSLLNEILPLAAAVIRLSGDRSRLDLAELAAAGGQLMPLVNRIAARLDVPPLRQQSLLALEPLDRAAEVAGILRSRVRLLETLAPFRRAADQPELN